MDAIEIQRWVSAPFPADVVPNGEGPTRKTCTTKSAELGAGASVKPTKCEAPGEVFPLPHSTSVPLVASENC